MSQIDILSLKSIEEVKALRWQDFTERDLTEEEFVHVLTLCDAFWMHSGDPKKPHAELTTGLCSNGFIDTLRALRFTNFCQILAAQSARKIRQSYNGPIDWVVGSDHAAATFSYAVASFLGAQHDFTEKGPDKTQIWKRFDIKEDEAVLEVEELITTGQTTLALRQGIREGNSTPVTFVPLIFTLIHRSDITELDGVPVNYLFHFDIWTSDPKDCKLCAQGSERYKPKHNWAALTGKTQ